MQRFNKAMIAVALGLIATISISAQAQPERYLTLTPPTGLPVIPVMEGWVANPDGTTTISFGTINRNEEDDIDIPVGENNYIEPAKYNGMQPTHFPSGRRTGIFTVTVPEAETDEDVWWYLKTGDSEVLKVPGRHGISAYELDFIRPRPQGSLQPLAGFGEDGDLAAGLAGQVGTYPNTVTAGSPATLTINVRDPSERDLTDPRFEEPLPVGVHFGKYQGTGDVEFTVHETTVVPEPPEIPDNVPANFRNRFRAPGPEEVSVEGGEGVARVYATFSEPGDYIIHVKVENFKASDSSNGDQCCWTNMYVRVAVTP